ncbi:MAG: UDP-N-acetylmuramoyl-tripeptide--D-alanyl-D-alanine ligase [Acidobacteria bacterium]|nr:UDP-N-acetylmuramoyl-tripeptide--D-alanyl-D-alanine ligase [Acidobacteriota bacterium]
MQLSETIKIFGSKVSDETLAAELSGRDILGYSIDSRTLRKGELFFAIRGEVHDGHKFVAEVLRRGAIAAVVNKDSDISANLQTSDAGQRTQDHGLRLFIADTLDALQQLASAVVKSWRGQLVAITGSAGKTTTKELTAATLEKIGRVMKTKGNLNNAYGLPLSILQMESNGAHADDFAYGVFEMGMNHAGEIAAMTKFAPPDVAVITNVAAVHLEYFASVDAIAEAKAELISGVKANGAAVLNADDVRVLRMRELRDDLMIRTYGIDQEAAVMARDIEADGLRGTKFLLTTPSGEVKISLPLPGRHNLYNALAAATVADFYQAPLEAIAEALAEVASPKMRGEVTHSDAGFTLIDDSYNSNPRALVEMVTAMTASKGYARKIVVAGEMLELGAAGATLHYEAGRRIAELGIDVVIGVRGLASELVKGAIDAGMTPTAATFFATSAEAAEFLLTEVRAQDLILVKGSRGVKTEIVVEKIKQKSP